MAGMNMQQMMKQARKMQAAVNEAVRGVNELANKQMGAITGGLNIPGMPF